MLPGRPQVLGETVGTETQADGIRRGTDQRIGSDVPTVRDDRYPALLQMG
jgi:hypothetical protein